ncbi:breast cancer anti-estrogen resistance protein 3 homolog isoform X1 [Sardina pilchardus]|uniref:breast cancer anti-estrogen resistance protein 3 homolog isoform X1 n=1 Tax=Sardina pilchardus TaxID=27697 RepID=UPI002E141D48
MMAEGKFASLPRNMHMGRQCPLASSMDLLSSSSRRVPGGRVMGDMPPSASEGYQGFSIHGTLPRKKKGGGPSSVAGRHWDVSGYSGSLPHPGRARLPSSPLIHNVIDEHQPFHTLRDVCPAYRDPCGMDPTMEYVKFSRDKYIMDGPPEKLRRELEEELKQASEEPRSHAWYHGAIPRQVAENLVQRDGDFLIRDSLSSPGNYVLTCQWKNSPQHFKISKRVVALNEAYSRVEYLLEAEGFDSVPALVRYYVGNRRPVSEVVGAIIFQPINRGLPLRCLEEKYGVGALRPDGSHLGDRKSHTSKRLSLNILNGHSQDQAISRGNLLSNKDKCGSQPACLNHVQERRRPLKTHQSESFLPLGSRPPAQLPHMDLQPSPKSPVFRTGSEPALSPTVPRKMPLEMRAGEAIRGSDSQLCPKPPPKPSKVPATGIPRSPRLQHLTPPPPLPPQKPQKEHLLLMIQQQQQQMAPYGPEVNYCELSPCGQADWERINGQLPAGGGSVGTLGSNSNSGSSSYVERLRRDEDQRSISTTSGGSSLSTASDNTAKLDRSSYHHAIEALDNASDDDDEDFDLEEEEEEEDGRRQQPERDVIGRGGGGGTEVDELAEEKLRLRFRRPVFETESQFRPGETTFRLLPMAENKPLEMSVLKRSKELVVSKDHRVIAKHLLLADCQVARTLNVSEEMKGQMGVTSGLELLTLPHGRQLRQDLMERHHTMAIAVAVDILGCTGSLEERAATLNRIVLVALELKDAMGDLFAFSSIMKALDMPQITRLDHTWTTLRRKYTQTAIIYEKSLKPFYKGLYEGTVEVPLSSTTIPLLLPLLTLMERPAVAFEGMELWESNDQGCEIMLRHLEEARAMAHNADIYTANAKKALQDVQADADLLEIFRTDFQLRLLWGSRGAAVNQAERYDKFNLILTALSRKLEPPVKHTEL